MIGVVFDRIPAPRATGGKIGEIRQIVTHDMEAPHRAGIARSLLRGYMQTVVAGAHTFTDPSGTTPSVPEHLVANHCGANPGRLGNELTGYAKDPVTEWLFGQGYLTLKHASRVGRRQSLEYGIPFRWLSVAQCRAFEFGHVDHNTIRLAKVGKTTHTDVGQWFPFDPFMDLMTTRNLEAGTVIDLAPSKPATTPPPNPTPAPAGDWLDMATRDEVAGVVAEVTRPRVFFAMHEDGVLWRGDLIRRTPVKLDDPELGDWDVRVDRMLYGLGRANAVVAIYNSRTGRFDDFTSAVQLNTDGVGRVGDVEFLGSVTS